MPINQGLALREARTAFGHLVNQMQSMHAACDVKPTDGAAVIQPVAGTDDGVTIECKPVVCRLPERASHGPASLYVVFTGWIRFQNVTGRDLLTASFATDFAYFVIRDGVAVHALGGHYDFAANHAAHPRAHMQLRSQAQMFSHATARFPSIVTVPIAQDPMRQVLSRVRPPTAQMDFLSFMLQLSADHLVDEKSSERVRTMFEALSASCGPLKGYQHPLPPDVCGCHRASHWYPQG